MRYTNLKRIKDVTREKAILMHIHFKELGLTKYSRDEIYSMVDAIGKEVMWKKTIDRVKNKTIRI